MYTLEQKLVIWVSAPTPRTLVKFSGEKLVGDSNESPKLWNTTQSYLNSTKFFSLKFI